MARADTKQQSCEWIMDETKKADLRERWTRLFLGIGCSARASMSIFDDLQTCYSSSDRHYHNLDHIHAVLTTLAELEGTNETPTLLLAAWFHDAIYDSRANDNEERSAAFVRCKLQPLGVASSMLVEIERLILLTKCHSTSPVDHPGQFLIDADLAILGANELEYDAYAQAIHREYAWVSELEYLRGRREVLERFLQRPRIFATEEMFALKETSARQNIQREIDALGKRFHRADFVG